MSGAQEDGFKDEIIPMLANVSKSLIEAEVRNGKIPERRIEIGGWGRN